MSQINKEFHEYLIREILPFEGFSYIPMMGGYLYYFNNRIVGGIYGNASLMVKITSASKKYMASSIPTNPYEGAKEMLPVTILDNIELFKQMIKEMSLELPEQKKKK